MSATTAFLCRLIGITFLILAIALAAYRPVMLDTVATAMHDRPLLVIWAIIVLVAGLALVLSHNVWRGLPAIIVTLIGWLIVIKAGLVLLLPPEALLALFGMMLFPQLYFVYAAITFVVGFFLTLWGFRGPRAHETLNRPLSTPTISGR